MVFKLSADSAARASGARLVVLGWATGAHGPVAAEKAVTVVSHAACAATRAVGGGGGAGNRTYQQLGLAAGELCVRPAAGVVICAPDHGGERRQHECTDGWPGLAGSAGGRGKSSHASRVGHGRQCVKSSWYRSAGHGYLGLPGSQLLLCVSA